MTATMRRPKATIIAAAAAVTMRRVKDPGMGPRKAADIRAMTIAGMRPGIRTAMPPTMARGIGPPKAATMRPTKAPGIGPRKAGTMPPASPAPRAITPGTSRNPPAHSYAPAWTGEYGDGAEFPPDGAEDPYGHTPRAVRRDRRLAAQNHDPAGIGGRRPVTPGTPGWADWVNQPLPAP